MASEKARKAAARKRATVRAQERTRRTLRTPGKTVEQGVGWGNVARGVARIVASGAKGASKTKVAPRTGSTVSKVAARSKPTAASKKEAISKLSASDRKRYETAVESAKSFRGATKIKSGRSKLTVAQKAPKKINQPRKPTSKQMAQAKAARDSWASTAKSSKATKSGMSKKKKAAIGAGVVTGVGALAYGTKPKSFASEGPKRSTPTTTVRGKKRKNVVTQKGGTTRFRG